MKTAIKTISFAFLPFVLLFFACSSPAGSESNGETTLSIILPGGQNGKVVGDPGSLQYEISGTGPNGKSFSETGMGGTTVNVTLVPGLWHVIIKAFDPGDSTKTSEAESESYDINVKAGKNNNLPIQMRFVQTAAVLPYLQAVGPTGTPVSLHLAVPLDSTEWSALFTAIATAGYDVDLDLSACTRGPSAGVAGLDSNGVFDPDSSVPTGKDKIVSLVLPDVADSIADGYPTFDHFSALKVAEGRNVTSIGTAAFYGCTSLVSVEFPKVASIGDGAFQDCTSLVSVEFPQATSIGFLAFANCTSLDSVEFPLASSIDAGAFDNCTSLVSVEFPLVTSIGDSAFHGCDNLESIKIPEVVTLSDTVFYATTATSLIIEMGSTAPTVGITTFFNITAPKNVTVKVSLGATGYGTISTTYTTDTTTPNWANAFRGMGWDGSVYLTGLVNSNITLTIEYK